MDIKAEFLELRKAITGREEAFKTMAKYSLQFHAVESSLSAIDFLICIEES